MGRKTPQSGPQALPLFLSPPETCGLNVLWHHWINRLSSFIHRMTGALGGNKPHAITQPDQGVGQTRGRGPVCPYYAPPWRLTWPFFLSYRRGCPALCFHRILKPQREKPCLQLTERHQTLPQFRKACSSAREHSSLRLLLFLLMVRMERNQPSSFSRGSQGMGPTALVHS